MLTGFHNGVKRLPPAPLCAALVVVLAAVVAMALPTRAYAQVKDVASYDIEVRLDAEAKRLEGRETVTFLNDVSQPVSELYLHLYPNAFRGPESTFMRENPAAARRAAATDNWGSIDVTALRLSTGEDLLAQAVVDDTVMRVPLPRPIGPGQSLRLSIDFSVKLPGVIARMGYRGDHFTIAQWFPKLAALTEDGWVAHQYHADSEFFADFGGYRVAITLPERFVVGASGAQVAEASNADGTKTLTFEAGSVHDFAWVANPDFREDRTRVGEVEIRLLYLAGHEDVKDRFLESAAAAVDHFGRWFGPYAYPLLTVADVPNGAGSGMEYPTLVTVSKYGIPLPGFLAEEQVTIHEVGHQWFYGMVASNEFEEAWLDEGFTSYATRKLVSELYGVETSIASLPGLHIGQLATERGQYLAVHQLDPVVQDSWEFYSSASYGGNVYSKASLILGTLEGYLGEEMMGRVMSGYFQRLAFRHPTTRDFIETVQDISGRDFERFFQDALYSSAAFDYSVESPGVAREGDVFRSAVTARRLGDGVIPVDVVTTFEDGHQEWEVWDGDARWQRYEYVRPSPAVKVEVDPERKLLLDTRWSNNSHTTWYNAEPVLRAAAALLWLAQGWLRALSFLI